ncbi:MAG: hypothetical protein R3C05_04855 [Pirellulaceae bacterium]
MQRLLRAGLTIRVRLEQQHADLNASGNRQRDSCGDDDDAVGLLIACYTSKQESSGRMASRYKRVGS